MGKAQVVKPKVVRLYPEGVVIIFELGDIKLKSEPLYGGDVVHALFPKTPWMKNYIREMKEGEVSQRVPQKVVTVNVIVARPKTEAIRARSSEPGLASGRARAVERAPINPETGRPYASEREMLDVTMRIQNKELVVEGKETLPPDDGVASDWDTAHQEILDYEAGHNQDAKPTGTKCPKCMKKLYRTTPGIVCINQHWKRKPR